MLPTPPTGYCVSSAQQPVENLELNAFNNTGTAGSENKPSAKMPASVYDTPPVSHHLPRHAQVASVSRRRFYGEDDFAANSPPYQQNPGGPLPPFATVVMAHANGAAAAQILNTNGAVTVPYHAQQHDERSASSLKSSSARLMSCFKNCFDTVDKCLYPICHRGDDEAFVPVSPRRRTLCLIGMFDIMIMFIIWLINAQIKGLQHNAIFIQEIINYNVTTSLFDTVALASVRFLLDWFFYGILRSRTIWWIALITAGSCGLIITKCFFYNFSQQHISPATSLDWIILVAAIVMTWVEAWFCDYHVLGAEERERHAYQQQLRGVAAAGNAGEPRHGRLRRSNSRTPLVSDNLVNANGSAATWQVPYGYTSGAVLSRDHHYAASSTVFHTPRGERALTEAGDILPCITEDVELAHEEEMRKQQLRERVQSVFEFVEKVSRADATGSSWKLEKRQEIKIEANSTVNTADVPSDATVTVESMQTREVGKIFRLTGVLQCNLKLVRREMFDNSEAAPDWNKLVTESKRLEMIDDNTDVMYYVTTGFGPVSSRDYVNVRRCVEQHDEHGRLVGYMLAMVHCEHAQAPTPRAHVRGEEGPSAMVFRLTDPVATDSSSGTLSSMPAMTTSSLIAPATLAARGASASSTSLAFQLERELFPRCHFTWYFKNDVKGWLPQKAVDTALSSAMLQTFELFRKHFRQLSANDLSFKNAASAAAPVGNSEVVGASFIQHTTVNPSGLLLTPAVSALVTEPTLVTPAQPIVFIDDNRTSTSDEQAFLDEAGRAADGSQSTQTALNVINVRPTSSVTDLGLLVTTPTNSAASSLIHASGTVAEKPVSDAGVSAATAL